VYGAGASISTGRVQLASSEKQGKKNQQVYFSFTQSSLTGSLLFYKFKIFLQSSVFIRGDW